jgi:hypothetical protein
MDTEKDALLDGITIILDRYVNDKMYTPTVALHKVIRLIEENYLFTTLDNKYK